MVWFLRSSFARHAFLNIFCARQFFDGHFYARHIKSVATPGLIYTFYFENIFLINYTLQQYYIN